MRTATFPAITLVVGCVVVAVAQTRMQPNPEAERAQIHYRLGWESLRSESWETAAKEFPLAMDL